MGWNLSNWCICANIFAIKILPDNLTQFWRQLNPIVTRNNKRTCSRSVPKRIRYTAPQVTWKSDLQNLAWGGLLQNLGSVVIWSGFSCRFGIYADCHLNIIIDCLLIAWKLGSIGFSCRTPILSLYLSTYYNTNSNSYRDIKSLKSISRRLSGKCL